VKAESTVKTWEKTRLRNLVRHKSGQYYARLFLNGKEIWKALKTSHFSVSEAKLAEVRKEHRTRRAKDIGATRIQLARGDVPGVWSVPRFLGRWMWWALSGDRSNWVVMEMSGVV